MINQDYDRVKDAWRKFWNRENHERPTMLVTAPKDGAKADFPPEPQSLEERWLNMDYTIKKARAGMHATYFGGEAFPRLSPNLGPDIIGAICGCGIIFGERTSWAVPNVKDLGDYPPITFDENNIWYRRIHEMTQAAIDDANGDYLVGMTDLHPGTDALVSLRGPEGLCLDIMDCPELINPRIEEIFDVYKQVFNKLAAVIGAKQEGSTNWMSFWHPDNDWYIPCSDFSCMISSEQFEEFVVPGLEKEIDFLSASIYHLDGPGALHHLDRILKFEKLNGMQWVPGDGAPPASAWIHIYKKIQAAGKNVLAHCRPDEVELLCTELEPEGLCIQTSAKTESDAKDLIRLAEKITKSKKR